MTTYKLKNLDVLLKTKRDVTEKLIYILSLSEKKKLTTKEIYQKGKEIFGEEFPKNKITVLRYLNTMLEYGMVKKEGWYWNLVDSKIPIEEIVAELDIKSIKESLKRRDGIHSGIVVFPDISIYKISPLMKKYFEKELSKIIDDLRKIDNKIHELNMECALKHIIEIYGKIESDQTLTTLDKWIIEAIGTITIVFLGELLLILVAPQNLNFTYLGEKANITDEELFFLRKLEKLEEPQLDSSIFIEDSGEIRFNSSYIIPMANLLKKYHPSRSREWFIDELIKYRCSKKIIEKIHEYKDTFLHIVSHSVDYLSPTIVINPMMRKIIKTEYLPSNYKELLHNFLISND